MKRLALFPLPQLVILPGIVMPLRFFEPRYVQMIERVLESEDRDFAMSRMLLKDEMDYHLSPPFESIGCRVVVLQNLQKKDGTYEVMIQGVERVFLQEGEPGDQRLYREVLAQSRPYSERFLGVWLEDHREKIIEKARKVSGMDRIFSGWDVGKISDRSLLNVISTLAIQSPELLQEVLEDDEAHLQRTMIEDWLRKS
jgi:Lon protease-like protein